MALQLLFGLFLYFCTFVTSPLAPLPCLTKIPGHECRPVGWLLRSKNTISQFSNAYFYFCTFATSPLAPPTIIYSPEFCLGPISRAREMRSWDGQFSIFIPSLRLPDKNSWRRVQASGLFVKLQKYNFTILKASTPQKQKGNFWGQWAKFDR